jgi:glycosyltransferase involved in cell wall biosynthesis
VKIAIHTDQLWFSVPGGIGTYVTQLVGALRRLKDGPSLVTFQVRERPPGAPAPDVEVPGSIRRLYASWDVLARPALPDELAGCDVVHATNHAAIPPARAGQALVATVHDLAYDVSPDAFPVTWRRLYRLGVRAAIRRADLLLAPSGATAAVLEGRGVDPARIRITPLASFLPPAGADPDEVVARLGIEPPFILCPATLEPRKNQVALIRAYRRVAADLPHALVLAGPDGWGVDQIDAELDRPGPGTVVRTGRVPARDLDALYRRADLVAYVSRYEGFGLPIVEAMERGVPVVSSTTEALAETAGDAALLVDPDDVGAIAEALAAALTHDGLRASLVARGRQRAATFSWEATASATLEAYREAVDLAADRRDR